MGWMLLVLAIIAIASRVVHRLFGLSNISNPFVFFFIYYTVFFFLGLSYAGFYEARGVVISPTVRLIMLYGYVATLLGAVFARMAFDGLGVKYRRLDQILIREPEGARRANWIAALMLLGIGIAFFLLFVMKTGFVAMFAENPEAGRIEARQGSGALTLLSITFVTFGGLYLVLSRQAPVLVRVLLFLVCAAILLSFGNRSPFLRFALIAALLMMFRSGRPIKLMHLAVIGIVLIALLALLGALRKGGESDASLQALFLARIPWRPFVTIYNFQRIYDFFPGSHGFIAGGGYLLELKTLLPGHAVNFGTWVKDIMGMEFEGGSLTISYLGDAYINFGLGGLLLAPPLYGFGFTALYYVFSKGTETTLKKAIFLMLLSIPLAGSATGGFMTPLMYYVSPFLVLFIIHGGLVYALRVSLAVPDRKAAAGQPSG